MNHPIRSLNIAITAGLLALALIACDNNAPIEGVEEFGKIKGGDHQAGRINYDQTPPVGGAHSGVWQNCGIYDQPVPLEYAVHSLEHGAVWVAYKPDLVEADVNKLRELVKGKPLTLLAPYQFGVLNEPVVATAWGVRLKLKDANDPRLPRFIAKYINNPNTPEIGASCSGAYGSPIQ
jgi:hypothetical protein